MSRVHTCRRGSSRVPYTIIFGFWLTLLHTVIILVVLFKLTPNHNDRTNKTCIEFVAPAPEVRKEEPELVEPVPEVKKEEPELVEPVPEVKKEEPETDKEDPELVKPVPEVKKDEPELVEPVPETKKEAPAMAITEIGAWGGGGGRPWQFLPSGGGITRIIVYSGWIVDSLSFVGRDGTEKLKLSGKLGSGYGGIRCEVTLKWPEEYLTAISGTIGDFEGVQVIRSLEFRTNHGCKYGPFGVAEGSEFNISMEGSAIVGFHGRSGLYVDAIGIYITPVSCIAK